MENSFLVCLSLAHQLCARHLSAFQPHSTLNIQSILLPPSPVATSPQEANVIKVKFREESSNRNIRVKHETDPLQHRIGEASESEEQRLGARKVEQCEER